MRRTLHLQNPPMEGKDVAAVQRLLNRKGFGPLKVDGVFSAHTGDACVAAKTKLKYPKGKRLPVCGNLLVAKLKAYDPKKVAKKARQTKNKKIRAAIVRYCQWGIGHEPQISYGQIRPMDRMTDLLHLPINDDCSEFTTKAYKYAGAPDPNGMDYNGLGWTGTMLQHGRRVTLWQAKPGDNAIFGAFPGHHVVTLMEPGHANNGNPWCCSHGQDAGPIKIRLKDEQRFQPSTTTYINYLGDLDE